MHHGEIWCKSCYAKRFGPKGYGYGLGAGALKLTQGRSGESNQAPKVFIPKEKGDFNKGSCHKCGHPVFDAEKMNCSNQVYHKQCFSCFGCGIQLESTTVNDHEYGIYCGACYAKEFGLGAGALKFTGTNSPPEARMTFHTSNTTILFKLSFNIQMPKLLWEFEDNSRN